MSLRVDLATTVSEVEALCTHLRANSTVVDVQHKPAVCRVSQIEIPHVLECTFVDLAAARSANLAAEWIATVCNGWHLVHQLERIGQEAVLIFVLLNGWLHLALHRLPNVIERSLRRRELATVVVEGGIDAEFVVGAAISEVQACGYREIGLESDGELVEKTFARWGSMGDKDTGLGRVIHTIRRVHEFAHL